MIHYYYQCFNIYISIFLSIFKSKPRTHTEKSQRQVSMVPQPFIFLQTKDTTTTMEVERCGAGLWAKLLYTINNHMVSDESIIDFTLFKLTATIN